MEWSTGKVWRYHVANLPSVSFIEADRGLPAQYKRIDYYETECNHRGPLCDQHKDLLDDLTFMRLLDNVSRLFFKLPRGIIGKMDRIDFENALKPHYDDALRYCHSLAARTHHTEAEDLFQESVLKALRKYNQLKERAKFRVWFFQIITRTHISQTRLAYWKHILRMPANAIHLPEVYAAYEVTGERAVLLNALAQLVPKHRAAFLLFELGGFSVEEIRVIQGDRSLSAVKSRLSRARNKLKVHILELENNQKRLNRSSAIKDLDYELRKTTQQALERLNG